MASAYHHAVLPRPTEREAEPSEAADEMLTVASRPAVVDAVGLVVDVVDAGLLAAAAAGRSTCREAPVMASQLP